MTEMWQGGCQCGWVRYAIEPAAILRLYCCHCRDCQRQSGSAFGMSMILPRSAFHLLQGTFRQWEHRADSGRIKRAHFCPTCGNRLFNDRGAAAGELSLKAGTLDDTSVLQPGAHLWTARSQPWLRVDDDTPCYLEEPPD